MLVDGQVHFLEGSVGKVLQDEVDDIGDTSGNWLTKLHPTVHHDAAIPEVEDLQVFEVVQVGLKVWNQLQGDGQR